MPKWEQWKQDGDSSLQTIAGELHSRSAFDANWNYLLGRGGQPKPPRWLERLREPGFEELAQLRSRLELWNGIEFLECGRIRV